MIIRKIIKAAAVLGMVIAGTGCRDHAYVHIYDRNITQKPIACLALRVYPPDSEAENAIRRLYVFKSDCPYTLKLSTKAGIHCNSNANAPLKATSNFPNAFLRLELRRGMKLLYSYYVDLTHRPDSGNIEDGFERIRNDLSFHGDR